MQAEDAIKKRWQIFCSSMDERQQRMWAAVEAIALGDGGVTAVANATGMSRRRIKAGAEELEKKYDGRVPSGLFMNGKNQRAAGAGRKPTAISAQQLALAIPTLLEGGFAAHKSIVFDWTTLSARGMAESLAAKHEKPVSPAQISTYLKANGFYRDHEIRVKPLYSIELRREQFARVHREIAKAHSAGQAVLLAHVEHRTLPSPRVDRSKLAGSLLAESVADPDGWKQADPDAFTARFALQLTRQWWHKDGQEQFSDQGEVLLCINAFGSKDEARDAWIQELANASKEFGVAIHNCYVPVGITRLKPLACQLASVSVMPGAGGNLARHKLILSVMPKKSIGRQLSNRSRSHDQSKPETSRGSLSAAGSFTIREDREMPVWNFSVSGK